jgi:hypothetical protein
VIEDKEAGGGEEQIPCQAERSYDKGRADVETSEGRAVVSCVNSLLCVWRCHICERARPRARTGVCVAGADAR